MTFPISLRPTVALPLQASKWQKLPMLIEVDEMRSLFSFLEHFWIVQVSGLISFGQEVISQESFLEVYCHYITSLQRGENPSDSRVRPYFSAILTNFSQALYAVKVKDQQCLIKVHQPVIQMQAYRFGYSSVDDTFRSMALGYDSIPWGIQFSYPNLYQNDNLQILKVKEGPQFPNTSLFKKLQHWTRINTIATPFEIKGKRVNIPMRLGKKCLNWINQAYPQLQAKGLRIAI